MSFSQILQEKAKPIWNEIFRHPFLDEFGKGILPVSKFKYFLQQDHIYVIEYCRPLGICVSKAETADEMKWFADLIIGGLTWEAANEEKLAMMVGMTPVELNSAQQSPTSRAYSDFLVQVAATGTISEFVAAMSPCMLTYPVIGRMLKKSSGIEKIPAYKAWTELYASDQAAKFADQFTGKLDLLGNTETRRIRNRMESLFLTASRYEYMFWDMSYKEEQWRV